MAAIASEIERFDRLSTTWWNPAGPMRPLHVVNALRLAHLLDRIASHFGRDGASLAGYAVPAALEPRLVVPRQARQLHGHLRSAPLK